MITKWFDEYGNILADIPSECITDCTRSGEDAYERVLDWVERLNFYAPPEIAIPYLKNFGAWDDLDTVLQNTLNIRVLWTACCEIHESGAWFGLME